MDSPLVSFLCLAVTSQDKESKERECWNRIEWRLNSENDSRLHGQPSFHFLSKPRRIKIKPVISLTKYYFNKRQEVRPVDINVILLINVGNKRPKTKILDWTLMVFSFLLEKSSMDGVYVIFILVEHHFSSKPLINIRIYFLEMRTQGIACL